ncbi:MAG: hypothetical protein FJ387_25535 [Verrucomicrobia bacterium]|nr:hypothetical protein [Verrucomicrobiota bacterium]
MNQDAPISASIIPTNSHLLEIVTVRTRDDRRVLAVLTREDIVKALAAHYATVSASGWSGIEVHESRVVKSWVPKESNTRRNRALAEAWLAQCTVHRTYSLAELGVSAPEQLLEKFFESKVAAPGAWWMRRSFPEGNRLREADLVATLRTYGFEVCHGDLVPVLLARPTMTRSLAP